MDQPPRSNSLTRRDLLKAGGAAAVTGLASGAGLLAPAPSEAQTPKRGGTLRLTFQSDPVTGFDPQQTISFVTMVPLSFVYSRLVKVKAGPSVKPMTYPIEPDLAESWTQPDDKTYVFKLKKGVRWHPKPPVNGREFTADDVKYAYDRFLTVTGNPNRPVLDSVDRIDVLDKYTVKFTLKEPNAWFLDMLASTSTWIIAKECVEKFGDLKKVESVVGTGPWMLERWDPNVRILYVRNPNYFVPGLPYADAVDMIIDKDPSSRPPPPSGRSRSISSPRRAGSSTSTPSRTRSACSPKRAIRTGSRRRSRRRAPATVPTSWMGCKSPSRTGRRPGSTPS